MPPSFGKSMSKSGSTFHGADNRSDDYGTLERDLRKEVIGGRIVVQPKEDASCVTLISAKPPKRVAFR